MKSETKESIYYFFNEEEQKLVKKLQDLK